MIENGRKEKEDVDGWNQRKCELQEEKSKKKNILDILRRDYQAARKKL